MASFQDQIKINGSKFETPLTIRHVESHLIFGPLSRHVPVAYLMAAVGVLKVIADLRNSRAAAAERTVDVLMDVVIWMGFLPFLLSRMTLRQQAVIAWGATKFAMGFSAFMMMTVGTGSSYQRGQTTDALVLFSLGLVWLPSIEFIPRLTPHQKYITLARLVLSIPLVVIGVRGGNWHWS